MLLAVERVGADVAALCRALAVQPEAIAARLDVDAATAAIGVQVGALGSAIDQLRLSLLAALDRTAERVEPPAWLPERLDQLRAAVAAADPGDRLAKVEAAIADLSDGVRAGGAIADALDHLGQRLASIEDAAGRVATDARSLVEQVSPVPDRLSAIATQIDRITPLARAGDNAETLFAQLARLTATLDEVVSLLRPDPAAATADGDAEDDDARFEAVVDVLAGVTRRQDEVTASVASVLDQVRGPGEQVLERLGQQEQAVARHLDWIGERLAEVAARLVPAAAAPVADGGTAAQLEATNDLLADLARRQDELAAMMARVLHHSSSPMALDAVFDRMEQRERAIAARLDRIDLQLRRSTARSDEGEATAPAGGALDHDAAHSLATSVEAIARVTEDLAALVESTSERLDRRLARVEAALDEAGRPPPPAAAARAPGAAEEAALRLARLRAERAEVQARLQEERLLAAQSWDDGERL